VSFYCDIYCDIVTTTQMPTTQAHHLTIVITGATGVIGGALARLYATQHTESVQLILQGRDTEALYAIARDCRVSGASVETVSLDLTDRDALLDWSARLQTRPIDLLIVNAGINIGLGPNRAGERFEEIDQLIEINIRSSIQLASGIVKAMRGRRAGQVAIISSLAAYYGLPMSPTYSASKAALKAFGESMRAFAAPDNVKVNVVMPGYVTSPMNDVVPGPKPFELPPAEAARLIVAGLEKNKARISFPFPLNLGAWWLGVLPASMSAKLLRWLGYRS
jgi:short-subunit dehydrogenase